MTDINVKLALKEAIKNSRAIIVNSEIYHFKWSAENKRYLEIKINEIFNNLEKRIEKLMEHNLVPVILFNKLHLMTDKKSDSTTHTLVTYCINSGYSKMTVEHFEENSSSFNQDIQQSDFEYDVIMNVLSSIKLISSDKVIKTILHDMVDKLDKEIKDKLYKNFRKED